MGAALLCAAELGSAPLIRLASRPSESRICSAVLVQTKGFGLSFHALTQAADVFLQDLNASVVAAAQ